MASADQLKALLKSHIAGDERRFRATALQLAAHQAKLGHDKLARELRALIDDAQLSPPAKSSAATPIGRPRGDLAELLTLHQPQHRLADLVVSPALHQQLQRIEKPNLDIHHSPEMRANALILGY